MTNHLVLMNEDGVLYDHTRQLVSATFDYPLVDETTRTITVDTASLCNLSPEQAQQLITSLQEDYDLS